MSYVIKVWKIYDPHLFSPKIRFRVAWNYAPKSRDNSFLSKIQFRFLWNRRWNTEIRGGARHQLTRFGSGPRVILRWSSICIDKSKIKVRRAAKSLQIGTLFTLMIDFESKWRWARRSGIWWSTIIALYSLMTKNDDLKVPSNVLCNVSQNGIKPPVDIQYARPDHRVFRNIQKMLVSDSLFSICALSVIKEGSLVQHLIAEERLILFAKCNPCLLHPAAEQMMPGSMLLSNAAYADTRGAKEFKVLTIKAKFCCIWQVLISLGTGNYQEYVMRGSSQGQDDDITDGLEAPTVLIGGCGLLTPAGLTFLPSFPLTRRNWL